jgi:hypothetical protein
VCLVCSRFCQHLHGEELREDGGEKRRKGERQLLLSWLSSVSPVASDGAFARGQPTRHSQHLYSLSLLWRSCLASRELCSHPSPIADDPSELMLAGCRVGEGAGEEEEDHQRIPRR